MATAAIIEGALGGDVDMDYNTAIDSRLTPLPTKIPNPLLHEIEQYQQRSYLTQIPIKLPYSLLDEIRQHQNRQEEEDRNEIWRIVTGILHVAVTDGDQCLPQPNSNCSFISPMIKKSRTLDVDDSRLSKLPLNEGSADETNENEGEQAGECVSNSPTTPDTGKRVHFNPRTSIELTISREDMTEEEMQNYWLQEEEFALIRLRDGYLGNLAEQKLRQMAKDSSDDTDTPPLSSTIDMSPNLWICTRGLEFKMKRAYLKIQDKRFRRLENVLTEQEQQWDEHWDDGRGNDSPFYYDDDAMAAVCSEFSNESEIHAQKVAANDRKEVEDMIWDEEEAEE